MWDIPVFDVINLRKQVHLIRMAFANATRPLLRSILMDYVAKRHRGKINALESVRAMSWSGSAALGGCVLRGYDTAGLTCSSNSRIAGPCNPGI